MSLICAWCEADASAEPCEHCGRSPLLDDSYALEAELGVGGLGVTYRAQRRRDGRHFAIKALAVRRASDLKALELFEREASVLRQLDHPGVPRYESHLWFREGRRRALFIVQELVEGQSLAVWSARHRASEAEVLEIAERLLEVLDYLHARSPPIIHRDLKPANVLRRPDGRLVLVDFGAVRDVLAPEGGSTVAGTFGFMAPEQLRGVASPASDLYGLGALLFALLARTDPSAALGTDGRLDWRRHLSASPRLAGLLDGLLEPDPARRLASVAEVRRVLAEDGPAVVPRPPSPPSAALTVPPLAPLPDRLSAALSRDVADVFEDPPRLARRLGLALVAVGVALPTLGAIAGGPALVMLYSAVLVPAGGVLAWLAWRGDPAAAGVQVEELSPGRGPGAVEGERIQLAWSGWAGGRPLRHGPTPLDVGLGMVPEPIDRALIGLAVGARRRIQLTGAQARGLAGLPSGLRPHARVTLTLERS